MVQVQNLGSAGGTPGAPNEDRSNNTSMLKTDSDVSHVKSSKQTSYAKNESIRNTIKDYRP